MPTICCNDVLSPGRGGGVAGTPPLPGLNFCLTTQTKGGAVNQKLSVFVYKGHDLLEKNVFHSKWRIWDRLQFCFPGGMGYFPGGDADQKEVSELGVHHTY